MRICVNRRDAKNRRRYDHGRASEPIDDFAHPAFEAGRQWSFFDQAYDPPDFADAAGRVTSGDPRHWRFEQNINPDL